MTFAPPVDTQDVRGGIRPGGPGDEIPAGADTGRPGDAPPTPRLLAGRYRLIEPLGRGGMGRVYRGLDERLDRPVAVKLIYDDAVRDRDVRHECAAEARAAARLNHPGIVRILDSGFDDGRCYVVMSLVEGRPLNEILREDRPLSVDRALDLAIQVADALAAAHAEGVIHCDVKPGNLLVDADGRVRLVDFGIARVTSSTTGLTGELLQGSAQYIAPEQVEGASVDARTDLYALGAVLYEMLAGETPFGGGTIASILARRLVNDPPSIREVAPSVPAQVDRVVLTALARDPAERFQTADELRDALRAARRRAADAGTASSRKAVASEAGRQIGPIAGLAGVATQVGLVLGPLLRAGRAPRTRGHAPRLLERLRSPLPTRSLRAGLAGAALGGLVLVAAAQHRAPGQAIEPAGGAEPAEVARGMDARAITFEPQPTPSRLPPTIVAAELPAEPPPTAPMPAEPPPTPPAPSLATPTAAMPAEPPPTVPAPTAAAPTPETPVVVAPVRRAPAPPAQILAAPPPTPAAPEPTPARPSAADANAGPTEQDSPSRDEREPAPARAVTMQPAPTLVPAPRPAPTRPATAPPTPTRLPAPPSAPTRAAPQPAPTRPPAPQPNPARPATLRIDQSATDGLDPSP